MTEYLLEDEQDNLWIDTDNGLSRFNHERNAMTFCESRFGIHIHNAPLADALVKLVKRFDKLQRLFEKIDQ